MGDQVEESGSGALRPPNPAWPPSLLTTTRNTPAHTTTITAWAAQAIRVRRQRSRSSSRPPPAVHHPASSTAAAITGMTSAFSTNSSPRTVASVARNACRRRPVRASSTISDTAQDDAAMSGSTFSAAAHRARRQSQRNCQAATSVNRMPAGPTAAPTTCGRRRHRRSCSTRSARRHPEIQWCSVRGEPGERHSAGMVAVVVGEKGSGTATSSRRPGCAGSGRPSRPAAATASPARARPAPTAAHSPASAREDTAACAAGYRA